ncbi:hypothetical protein ACE6H2_019522 [Prunus campanulata]
MVLQNRANGYESKFVKQIVKVVDEKLSRLRTPFIVASYPIGIDSRVKYINSWLNDGSADVGIILVNGIGGIGKTTIAKFVYNLNFRKFEGSCFLEDVRETSRQPNGLVQLQLQFLYHILSGREVKIHSVSEGINKIRDAIISKRVLLVLDDVDDMHQIKAIFGMLDWFYPHSKIIITTRCAGLLRDHGLSTCKVYNVETMKANESLELFSWHAFGQAHPCEDYMKLSEMIADRCKGLPLALQVLGSSLFGRTIDVWKSALEKLKAIPNNEILQRLRISYDALQDNPHDQNLFLHIACFFVGKRKYYIVRVLDGCDFFTIVGIENLLDRCLVTVDENQKVNMHQMICDMGREIVRLESKEPEKRSRLWNDTDSFNVLREKSGTETIEGLALDMHMHSVNTPWGDSDEIVFKSTAFARMSKLRLLHLSHVQFKGCYEEFPKGLRWLCWLEFPLKSLPSDLPLERLVYLEMPHSNMRQVFKGIKYLPSLKNVDLGHSHCLTEISNFSLVPNLESLVLEDCSSLVDVHESIGNLKRLVCLNLKGCKKIRKLPKNLFNLQSLDTLTLSGCSNLNEFWTELGKMKSLKVLDIAEIPISQVLMNTTGEVKPRIGRNPESLWSFLPRCLAHLNIRSCSLSDEAFPKDFGNLHSLEFLDLSRNPIRGLPHCVRGLRGLVRLIITQCSSLQTLEGLPRVTNFAVVDCGLLKRITFQSSLCVPIELLSVHNVKLVEIEYLYKFVPIARCDAETIKLLGLCNLKFKGITIRMLFPSRNSIVGEVYKYHIQVLYEYGIISTFLPGNVVPGQFSHKNRGSCSISFTVPCSNARIRGLNIFSVYTSYDGDLDPGYSCDKISPIVTKVHNKSTGMKWIYDPSLIGFPDLGEDMIFLSHWSLGNELKGGDQVIVSMFMRSSFQGNEWGIQLVHEQHQDQEKMMIMIAQKDDNAVPSFPFVVFGRLPEFEMLPRTYFLSNGPLSRRTLTFGHWKESDLFDDIFGDGDSHYSDEETDKQVLQQGVQNKIQKVEPRSRLRKHHMPFMLRVLHDNTLLASRAT